MIDSSVGADGSIESDVRHFVFETVAATANVPQACEIAEALKIPPEAATAALKHLAEAKVIILAPNNGDIWAANPFCAVHSGFRVEVDRKQYWGICVWDALGIVAALNASSALIHAPCGDCGDILRTEFKDGKLESAEGVIHFAVPARDWWKNIGYA